MPEQPEILLHDLIHSLRSSYGYERSVKFISGNLLAERILMSIHKSALGEKPESTLVNLLTQLNAPQTCLDRLVPQLSTSDIVHFGFEADDNEYIYKCYLEDVEAFTSAEDKGSTGEVPVYIAFKWSPSNKGKYRVSHYHGYPSATLQEVRQLVTNMYQEQPGSAGLKVVEDIMDSYINSGSEDIPMIMIVTEETNQRRSFDLNLYDMELDINQIGAKLAGIAAYFQIPDNKWDQFMCTHGSKLLGHLAGGLDAHNHEFFTVYFGVEGH